MAIAEQLGLTRRLYHMDNNTGGFYVALLRHRGEATPEGTARVYISKRKLTKNSGWEPKIMSINHGSRHDTIPALDEEIASVSKQYSITDNQWTWWKRGRRLNITPRTVFERIYHPMCPNKDGNLWQNNTFHPLKIVHAGMPCFVNNKGTWRTRQEAIPAIENHLGDILIDIDHEMVIRLLNDEAILKQDVLPPSMVDFSGPVLLCSEIAGSKALVSAWSGNWISLMINTTEKDILRAKLAIPFEHEVKEA